MLLRVDRMLWHPVRMLGSNKRTEDLKMGIVLLILLFCGAMLLLDRMLCGFVKKMSNSKKMKK